MTLQIFDLTHELIAGEVLPVVGYRGICQQWLQVDLSKLKPRSIGKPFKNFLDLDWLETSSALLPTKLNPKHSKWFTNRNYCAGLH
jgi:hypothetical protein